jgi:hypothetical protein
MRPVSLRRWARGVSLSLVLISFGLPAGAHAAVESDTELHPSLRARLADPLTTPFSRLRVIAIGGDARRAPRRGRTLESEVPSSLAHQGARAAGGGASPAAAATWDAAPTWEALEYRD